MKARRIIGNAIVYLILAVLSLIWITPLIWLIFQSLSQQNLQVGALSYLFPQFNISINERNLINLGFTAQSNVIWGHFTFLNYADVLSNRVYVKDVTQVVDVVFNESGTMLNVTQTQDVIKTVSYFNYGRWFFNTLTVALFTALISTFLSLCTSYAFSRLRFKARKGIMKFILILGMFPSFLTLIVVYQVLKLLGLQASLVGLVLCYTGGAGMNYYVLKGFFDTISKSVDEAAMIDGCNKWQIFTKVTMPLSKPIIVYTVLTAFMGPWGDYVTSSYLMGTNKNSYTIAVGLYKMTDATLYQTRYWLQFCSGAVLIAIPIAILFMCLQRYYVSGITGGAVKG